MVPRVRGHGKENQHGSPWIQREGAVEGSVAGAFRWVEPGSGVGGVSAHPEAYLGEFTQFHLPVYSGGVTALGSAYEGSSEDGSAEALQVAGSKGVGG